MSLEFIAKRGFITPLNAVVTGSLTVVGVINGNIVSASQYTGSLFGTASWAANGLTTASTYPITSSVSIIAFTSSLVVGLLTASVPGYIPGKLYYDTRSFAYTYFNDISTDAIMIGRETRTRCFNSSSNYISTSCAVYFSGSNMLGYVVPNVWLAIADGTGTRSNVAGVATTDMAPLTFGYTTISGKVDSITSTLPLFNFPVGPLYLSPITSGSYTTTPPTASFEKVFVGYCILSSSLGSQMIVDTNPHSWGAYSSSFALVSFSSSFAATSSTSSLAVTASFAVTTSYARFASTSSQGAFAWSAITYDGTILTTTSYNSFVTRSAKGSFIVSFNNRASSTAYASIFNGGSGSRAQQGTLTQSFCNFTGNTTGGTTMSIFNISGSAVVPFVSVDFTTASYVIFGY